MNTCQNNSYAQFEALSVNEMMVIDGGGFMYDMGHFVGSVTQGVIVCVIAAAILAGS